MKGEKNRKSLKNALDRLPAHQPGETTWENIAQEMERQEQQERLQAALRRLPSYQPPGETWDRIEAQLPAGRSLRTRRILLRTIAAAAVLSGLVLALQWTARRTPSEQVYLVYSEEAAPPPLPASWEEDQIEIELIRTQFADIPDFAAADNHDRLQRELAELEAAKSELSVAIERYGINDLLAREMAHIEKERTDVLEEMASQI